jgi:hypothetical protein
MQDHVVVLAPSPDNPNQTEYRDFDAKSDFGLSWAHSGTSSSSALQQVCAPQASGKVLFHHVG